MDAIAGSGAIGLDGRVPQAVVGDDGSEPITLRTIVTGVIRAW